MESRDLGIKRSGDEAVGPAEQPPETKKRRLLSPEDLLNHHILEAIKNDDIARFSEYLPSFFATRSRATPLSSISMLNKLSHPYYFTGLLKELMMLQRDSLLNVLLQFILDKQKKELGTVKLKQIKGGLTINDVCHSLVRSALTYSVVHEELIVAFVRKFNVKLNQADYFHAKKHHPFDIIAIGSTVEKLKFILTLLSDNQERLPTLDVMMNFVSYKSSNYDYALAREIAYFKLILEHFPQIKITNLHNIKHLHKETITFLQETNIELSLESYPPRFLLAMGQLALYDTKVEHATTTHLYNDLVYVFNRYQQGDWREIGYVLRKIKEPLVIEKKIKIIELYIEKFKGDNGRRYVENVPLLIDIKKIKTLPFDKDDQNRLRICCEHLESSMAECQPFNTYGFISSLLSELDPGIGFPFFIRAINITPNTQRHVEVDADMRRLCHMFQFIIDSPDFYYKVVKYYLKKDSIHFRPNLLSHLKNEYSEQFNVHNQNGMTILERCLVEYCLDDANEHDEYRLDTLFTLLESTIMLPPHEFQFKGQNFTILRLINEEPRLHIVRGMMMGIPRFRQFIQGDVNRGRIRARVQQGEQRQIHQHSQSTHAAAVHKTVSESAKRLLQRYCPSGTMPNVFAQTTKLLAPYFVEFTRVEFIARLEKKYKDLSAEVKQLLISERLEDLTGTIKAEILRNKEAFENIVDSPPYQAILLFRKILTLNPPFVDPESKISLPLAFFLIGKALTDETIFKDAETRESEMRLFIRRLSELKNEYGEGHASCASGTFNAIIEFLDKKHPDVTIEQISGENIEFYIKDYFEAAFEKLSDAEKIQLTHVARALNKLPPAFVEERKDGFYQSINEALNKQYISKEQVDAWFDIMTGDDALYKFPAIHQFKPEYSSSAFLLFSSQHEEREEKIEAKDDAMDLDGPTI